MSEASVNVTNFLFLGIQSYVASSAECRRWRHTLPKFAAIEAAVNPRPAPRVLFPLLAYL
jgi:hypothetical protein